MRVTPSVPDMKESIFAELKRYVGWSAADESALRALHPQAAPRFAGVSEVFYEAILRHPLARQALTGGESQVGHLKATLQAWMDRLLAGPWDEAYFQARCRIGRRHVLIDLPQHYMFGAMNVIRGELQAVAGDAYAGRPAEAAAAASALGRILDLELAIMLHTYREDLLARHARTERLRTFGQLVASIGHDLRNPLAVIDSSVYLLRARLGDSADGRAVRQIDRIGEQVGVATGIIDNLLDMVRDRPLVREAVSLEQVLENVAEVVRRPSGVTFTANGLAGLLVDGDPVQLRQVFVNLVTNAVEAVSPQGSVFVQGAREAGGVTVLVDDSGSGVDPQIARRLFEPLITTKERGTGLGLALVKKLVERHGGTVAYERAPAGGARFAVRLPSPSPLPA